MTQTAQTVTSLNRARSAAGVKSAVQRELIGWAWLAVGALAVAGVFALLLALSRIPGMEKTPFWPIDFFYKGLVIHVVFSLVIWLQGVFAFLVSVATLKLAGDDVRAAPLGRIGQGAVLLAFPCLFAPAFLEATQPALTNYIPIIRHPAYDIGLIVLALGALAPVVRLLLNLPGRLASAPPFAVAMALGGFVYVLALICFAVATTLLAHAGELASREELFWGGGHVLQFVYAALMVTNWSLLARMSLGEEAVDSRVFLGSRRSHRADRNRRAGVLRDLRSLLRQSARGVPVSAVRDRRADADLRCFACHPRASLARPMAMARSGFLRPCDVAGALRARRRDGLPDRRLRHPHARALSRGHHRGQRLERRHAAHLRPQGTRQAGCAAARDPRS